MTKRNLIIAALFASQVFVTAPAFAGTIQVDDGNGGWTPYVAPAQPGPGISVDDGKGGWKPYKAKKIAGNAHGISVDDGNGGWKPYVEPVRPGRGISVDDGKGGWKPYSRPVMNGAIIGGLR